MTQEDYSPVSPLSELIPKSPGNYYPFIPFGEIPSLESRANLTAP